MDSSGEEDDDDDDGPNNLSLSNEVRAVFLSFPVWEVIQSRFSPCNIGNVLRRNPEIERAWLVMGLSRYPVSREYKLLHSPYSFWSCLVTPWPNDDGSPDEVSVEMVHNSSKMFFCFTWVYCALLSINRSERAQFHIIMHTPLPALIISWKILSRAACVYGCPCACLHVLPFRDATGIRYFRSFPPSLKCVPHLFFLTDGN